MAALRPVLKADHKLPFFYSRECPQCHKASFCINFSNDDAYLRCANYWCVAHHQREPLPCVLRHRAYQKDFLRLTLGDDRTLTQVAQRGVVPDMYTDRHDPKTVWAPYQDCRGEMRWAAGTRSVGLNSWFRCSACAGLYHAVPLVTWDESRGEIRHHSRFRIVKGLDGKPTVVDRWSSLELAEKLPMKMAFVILNVQFDGVDIRETEAFFGSLD